MDNDGAVHPHIRGVFTIIFSDLGRGTGPSPHTWGFRMFAFWSPRQSRSIPTYVGFSYIASCCIRHVLGPSPHTWGFH